MKKIKSTTTLFLITALFMTITSVNAQNKYIGKKGKLTFEASEELFEPVKAVNESVTVILNTATNEIASLALMKSFRFENSLMEEHFNENYIESETYPKAIFKGKLVDFNISSLSVAPIEVLVDGKLQLHGKEKEIKTVVNLQELNGVMVMKGGFSVSPSDFDIEIPSVVKNKIAKEIKVSLDFELAQQ